MAAAAGLRLIVRITVLPPPNLASPPASLTASSPPNVWKRSHQHIVGILKEEAGLVSHIRVLFGCRWTVAARSCRLRRVCFLNLRPDSQITRGEFGYDVACLYSSPLSCEAHVLSQKWRDQKILRCADHLIWFYCMFCALICRCWSMKPKKVHNHHSLSTKMSVLTMRLLCLCLVCQVTFK